MQPRATDYQSDSNVDPSLYHRSTNGASWPRKKHASIAFVTHKRPKDKGIPGGFPRVSGGFRRCFRGFRGFGVFYRPWDAEEQQLRNHTRAKPKPHFSIPRLPTSTDLSHQKNPTKCFNYKIKRAHFRGKLLGRLWCSQTSRLLPAGLGSWVLGGIGRGPLTCKAIFRTCLSQTGAKFSLLLMLALRGLRTLPSQDGACVTGSWAAGKWCVDP